tara:strand:- start:76 stop:219 length:144 start_codon:yes stop_codon:yes gene_type:complete
MIEILLDIPFELKLIFLGGLSAICLEWIRSYREKKRKRQERLNNIKW